MEPHCRADRQSPQTDPGRAVLLTCGCTDLQPRPGGMEDSTAYSANLFEPQDSILTQLGRRHKRAPLGSPLFFAWDRIPKGKVEFSHRQTLSMEP